MTQPVNSDKVIIVVSIAPGKDGQRPQPWQVIKRWHNYGRDMEQKSERPGSGSVT